MAWASMASPLWQHSSAYSLVLEGREVDEDVEPRALHGSLERQRRNAEVAHDIRIGRADKRCEQLDGFQTDLHHRQGDLRAVAEARLHRAAANGLLGVILLGQGEGFDEHVEHLAVAVHHVHEALLELVALGDGVENALTVVLKALFGECEAVDHHGQRDADAARQTRDRAAAGGAGASEPTALMSSVTFISAIFMESPSLGGVNFKTGP